jgi:hypothetical protein
MNLDQIEHKENLYVYFAADALKLHTGESPNLEGLLFLLTTGDVSQKIKLKDQFLASSMASYWKSELEHFQVSYDMWLDSFDISLSKYQKSKLNHLDAVKSMRIDKAKKEELIYLLFNLNLVRNNEVPILNHPKKLVKAFLNDSKKEIAKLQHETLELLNS